MGSFGQFFEVWKSSHNGAYNWVLSLLGVLFFSGLDFFSLYEFYQFSGICIISVGQPFPFWWLARPRWIQRWTFIFLCVFTWAVIFGKPYEFPFFDELFNSIFQVKTIVSFVFDRFVKLAECGHVCPYTPSLIGGGFLTHASCDSAFAHSWKILSLAVFRGVYSVNLFMIFLLFKLDQIVFERLTTLVFDIKQVHHTDFQFSYQELVVETHNNSTKNVGFTRFHG